MVRYIITGMEKVSTSGFDDAQAKEFIMNISPDTSAEMVETLIQDSCKVPGLLRECVLQENNVVVLGEHLKRHLSDMLPYVPEYECRLYSSAINICFTWPSAFLFWVRRFCIKFVLCKRQFCYSEWKQTTTALCILVQNPRTSVIGKQK